MRSNENGAREILKKSERNIVDGKTPIQEHIEISSEYTGK